MIAYVNTEYMAICDPKDDQAAKQIAEYIAQLIRSQANSWTSSAVSDLSWD